MTAELVKDEPDCPHGEEFNISGIKQSLVSYRKHAQDGFVIIMTLSRCLYNTNVLCRPDAYPSNNFLQLYCIPITSKWFCSKGQLLYYSAN